MSVFAYSLSSAFFAILLWHLLRFDKGRGIDYSVSLFFLSLLFSLDNDDNDDDDKVDVGEGRLSMMVIH